MIALPRTATLEPGRYHILITKNGETPESGMGNPDWKQGFGELYSFFRNMMKMIGAVVTTQTGKEIWNKTLKEQNLGLISELGRSIN